MSELMELHTNDALDEALEQSQQKPILLFKHSTTCPISARAFNQYKTYLESVDEDIAPYMVKVIEDRDVSNRVEVETGVKHESPQVFLIKGKEVLWNTSHSKITVDRLNDAIRNAVK